MRWWSGVGLVVGCGLCGSGSGSERNGLHVRDPLHAEQVTLTGHFTQGFGVRKPTDYRWVLVDAETGRAPVVRS